MIHVRNLVKSRGDSKNASSGLASASVSLSSGQRILVLDPKDGQLGDIEVRAFDGNLVRGFTEVSFEHIVSGSSNKWDTARDMTSASLSVALGACHS